VSISVSFFAESSLGKNIATSSLMKTHFGIATPVGRNGKKKLQIFFVFRPSFISWGT